jgi:DNA-binding response OmpR family regulator
MRILVVEDQRKLARLLHRGLREESYAVDVAADGEEGAFRAMSDVYDLILLDVMLPRKDGFQVLRELRAAGVSSRVLLLTARDAVADRVRGLDLGADDYLVKPFAFDELLARVRALLRRDAASDPVSLRAGDLVVDLKQRTVTRDGRSLSLTAREFAVLACLLRHADQTVTRTQLAEQVWDENFDPFSNVIEVTVYHVREKVDRGFSPPLIHTVRGVGYILKRPTTAAT